MMKKTIKTRGICANAIEYEIDGEGCVRNVRFSGGCSGNGHGISALVDGMMPHEVIRRLKGISCRMGTSCPDQLARALMQEEGENKG